MDYAHETWTVTIQSGERQLSIEGIRSPYGHTVGHKDPKSILVKHMEDVLNIMVDKFIDIPKENNQK